MVHLELKINQGEEVSRTSAFAIFTKLFSTGLTTFQQLLGLSKCSVPFEALIFQAPLHILQPFYHNMVWINDSFEGIKTTDSCHFLQLTLVQCYSLHRRRILQWSLCPCVWFNRESLFMLMLLLALNLWSGVFIWFTF